MTTARRWELATVATALVLLAGGALLREHSIYRLYFATGWALLCAIGVDLVRRLRDADGECVIGTHAALSLLATSLFATHLELRIPDGWIEGTLALLFLILLSNAIMGSLVQLGLQLGALEPRDAGPDFARSWMLIHIPLTASLVALGIVHGVLSHSHGLIAYTLLGS